MNGNILCKPNVQFLAVNRNAPLCPQCDELLQSYPSAEEFYLHLCQVKIRFPQFFLTSKFK